MLNSPQISPVNYRNQEMLKNRCVCAAVIIGFVISFSSVMAGKGRDGSDTIAANSVINYYSAVTNIQNGANVIVTVTDINNLDDVAGLYASVDLSPGDKIMLYQAQGAEFTLPVSNSSSYGEFSLNEAGRYEIHEVVAVSGNDITLGEQGNLCTADQIIYSFDATETQVVRIPQFEDLTINGGVTISATPWNGSIGGVVAIDVNGTLTLNGSIDVTGQGFRGGVLENSSSPAGQDRPNYFYPNQADGAEKGEGIIGFQAEYDAAGGRYGRGAPANGGGGGNGHNAGGGGGANGGDISGWNGQGNPNLSDANWSQAWDIDGTLTSATTSTGGGRGGYTYGSSDQNALTTAPGNATWGGNNRRERGGLGGRPVPFDVAGRLFFGGGGGAGDGNNNQGSNGGAGGGLVFVIADTITGTGTVVADGNQGEDTQGGGNNDAPGGGGAGGTVVIAANALSGITLSADGGVGGDQLPINNENEGPGGGGGGGVIAVSGGAVTTSAAGGVNGITQSTALTEFLPNGATMGASGLPNESTPSEANLPICNAMPALTVTKTATLTTDNGTVGQADYNDVITFSVSVQNTGDIELNTLVVNDPMGGGALTCAPTTLAPNATATCNSYTYTVTQTDVDNGGTIDNTATASATDPSNTPVNDNDSTSTPIAAGSAALTVTKTATLTTDNGTVGQADAGDVITFAVSVQNTGTLTITGLVVNDPMGGGALTCTPTTLAPNVTATCNSYTYTVTQNDVDNGGTIDNTATANGTDPSNNPVTDNDSTSTPIAAGSAALTVTKTATLTTDNGTVGQADANDVITFAVSVQNTGTLTITGLTVNDPMGGGALTCTPTTLAPNVTATCNSYTYTVTQNDVDNGGTIDNTATANGTDPSNNPVTDNDSTSTPIAAGSAALTVTKTATLTTDNGTVGQADANDVITFAVSVQNTGTLTITGLTVNDPMGGGALTCAPTTLAPNVTATCNSYTYTVTQTDVDNGGTIDNTASATAMDPSNNPVNDDDSTSTPIAVAGPSLVVAKSMTNHNDVDGDTLISLNDILTFTITATNNGNVTLNNVVVSDPMITPNSNSCPTVIPGATCQLVGIYTVSQTDVDNGEINNTGTGDSDNTPPVTDTITTPIPRIPALTVTKTATITTDNGTLNSADAGDVITFAVSVENTGNVTLTNLVVNDPMGGGALTCNPTTIAPGASATCNSYTYTVTQTDVDNGGTIDNTATATADDPDPNSPPVTDDDSTNTPITVSGPSLVVAKSMTNHNDVDNDMVISVGDELTYTVAANNNGNVTLNNVVVSDPMITPNSITCPTVAPGANCELVGTYTVQQSDLDNGQIDNTGTGDSDETPPVDDDHTISLSPQPALVTNKTLSGNADEDGSGSVTEGDTLTFTIDVTNSGNVTLTQVTVTDDMITPNMTVCPVLQVGEVCTLVGTYVVTASDVANGQIINVAEGTSVETGPDPDTDTETVIVNAPATPVPTLNIYSMLMLLLATAFVARRRLR
jgi:uncharacterized repeat protein (TIGR01451 family)